MVHYTIKLSTDKNYNDKELAKIIQELLKDNCGIENTTTVVQKYSF